MGVCNSRRENEQRLRSEDFSDSKYNFVWTSPYSINSLVLYICASRRQILHLASLFGNSEPILINTWTYYLRKGKRNAVISAFGPRIASIFIWHHVYKLWLFVLSFVVATYLHVWNMHRHLMTSAETDLLWVKIILTRTKIDHWATNTLSIWELKEGINLIDPN